MKRITRFLSILLAGFLLLSFEPDVFAGSKGRKGNSKIRKTNTRVTNVKTPRTSNRILVRQKAPALRTEIIPLRPSPRAVWIPGQWIWNYRLYQWSWVTGYWDLYPMGSIRGPGYWPYGDGLSFWISSYWGY